MKSQSAKIKNITAIALFALILGTMAFAFVFYRGPDENGSVDFGLYRIHRNQNGNRNSIYSGSIK